jgi:hypothetical protein
MRRDKYTVTIIEGGVGGDGERLGHKHIVALCVYKHKR